jgi:hypothetical protein
MGEKKKEIPTFLAYIYLRASDVNDAVTRDSGWTKGRGENTE